MRRLTVMATAVVSLLVREANALKTHQVDFGTSGTYDGQVYIARDTSGSLVFRDTSVTTPTALSALAGGGGGVGGDHGSLSGLGDDDHTQYLNTARHQSAHTAGFNAALATPGDVDGNATLGGHLSDPDIHVNRLDDETIPGAWRFSGTPEMRSNLRFSNNGAAGTARLIFEDGAEDAELKWNPAARRFETNRDVAGKNGAFDEVSAGDVAVRGTLDGQDAGDRSGVIRNFASIEGVYPPNLLDRTADETVTGQWLFSNRASFGRLRAPTGASPPASGNVQGDLFWRGASKELYVYDGAAWAEVSGTGPSYSGYVALDWLSSDSDLGTRASIHYQVQVALTRDDFTSGGFALNAATTDSVAGFHVSDGLHIDPFPAAGLTSIDAGKRVFYETPNPLASSPNYYARVIAWDGETSSTAALIVR